MKPTPQFLPNSTRRGPRAVAHRRAAFPATDYNYHPGSIRDYSGRGGDDRSPSIRAISREYFDTDARQTFATEATLFGLIVAIVAVPVIEGARGLLQFVQATGLV